MKPEDGYAEHEKMLANAERVLQLLDCIIAWCCFAPATWVLVSATYDIEVWVAVGELFWKFPASRTVKIFNRVG